jgi:hypothetical protein
LPRELIARAVREAAADAQEFYGRLNVQRRSDSRDKRGVGLERVGRSAGHPKCFDEAKMCRLIEWQRGRPSLRPCDGAAPVAAQFRVADEFPHRDAKLSVERRTLVFDPATEALATDVLGTLEEIAGPPPGSFLRPPLAQISLEQRHVQLDGIDRNPYGLGVDIDFVTECLFELEERLTQRLARTILAALAPEKSRQLGTRDRARRATSEITQQREWFPAQGTGIPIARLAQPT